MGMLLIIRMLGFRGTSPQSCPVQVMCKGHTAESSKRLSFSWKEGTFYMSITRKDLSEGTQMGGTKWPLEHGRPKKGLLHPQTKDG